MYMYMHMNSSDLPFVRDCKYIFRSRVVCLCVNCGPGLCRGADDYFFPPLQGIMCSTDPRLNAQQNAARCWAIVALIFGCISLLPFLTGLAGVAAGLGGVLAIVAGSMPLCCLTPENAKGLFKGSFVLSLLAVALHAVSIGLTAFFLTQISDSRGSAFINTGGIARFFLTFFLIVTICCMLLHAIAMVYFFRASQSTSQPQAGLAATATPAGHPAPIPAVAVAVPVPDVSYSTATVAGPGAVNPTLHPNKM